MKSRFLILAVFCALVLGLPKMAFAQTSGGQSELSTGQRLDVMSSKLDLLRRSLSSAIRVMTDKSKDTSKDTKANADDPIVRLKGLEKEVSSLSTEVNDIRTKNDKAEKFDSTAIDRLEASVAELNTRVESTLQETAGLRNTTTASSNNSDKKKKKGKLLGVVWRR